MADILSVSQNKHEFVLHKQCLEVTAELCRFHWQWNCTFLKIGLFKNGVVFFFTLQKWNFFPYQIVINEVI